MKKAVRRVLRISAIAAGLVVVILAAAALLFLFDKSLVKNMLESQISKRAGAAVRIGRLDYRLFPLRVSAGGISFSVEDAYSKASVSLARLDVEGNFLKILRGEASAIRKLEAEGFEVRFDLKAVREEPFDFDPIIARAREALAGFDRIILRDIRLSISLPSGQSAQSRFDLSLSWRSPGRDLAYSLGGGHFELEDKAKARRLQGDMDASGTLRLAPSFAIESGLKIGSLKVDAPELAGGLEGIELDARGGFDMATKEVTLSSLKIGIPGLADFKGTARGSLPPRSSLQSRGTIRFEKLENLAGRFGSRLPPELRAGRISGRAEISGEYEMAAEGSGIRDRLKASASFDDVNLENEVDGIPVQARVSSRIGIEGPISALRFSADFRLALGRIVRDGFVVGNAGIHLVAGGTKDAVDVSLFESSLGNIEFPVAPGKKVSFESASLSGRARVDLKRKTMNLPSLDGRLAGLPPFKMAGRFSLDKGSEAAVDIQAGGIDVQAVRTLAAPFLPEGLASWDLGGSADLALEVRTPLPAGAGLGFKGTLSLSKVKFNDPTFSIAGEDLHPEIKIEGAYAPDGSVSFAGSGAIHSGESLVKSFYISWVKNPLQAAFKGGYNTRSGDLDIASAEFRIPTIGEAELSGSVKLSPQPRFSLTSKASLKLGPFYSLFSQAGTADKNRAKIEGTFGADITAANDAGPIVIKGRLSLADAGVELPASGVRLSGVAAAVPIRIEAGGSKSPAAPGPFPEEGFFRVAEFQSPLVSLSSLAVSLRGGTNSYEIEPLSLSLFGGAVDLGRMTIFIDAAGRTFRGAGSLAIKDIDISRIPVRLPDFKLTGRFRAVFPRLDIGPKQISTSGGGEAEIFGGRVVLSNLAVTDPLAPGRSISMDLELRDLDLKKLTDEVPFGEVTGIVRGEVRGLVISYGQPARFDFRIESVPRRGVPRTFSLKAVDNLTILSGGQEASGGTTPFWTRFIRGFRYAKMGIVSTLRNDTFTLNGTIREGGVEYLVKKPALFGINVVNRMPDKAISFKDMTDRLKRVGRAEK